MSESASSSHSPIDVMRKLSAAAAATSPIGAAPARQSTMP